MQDDRLVNDIFPHGMDLEPYAAEYADDRLRARAQKERA